MRPTFTTIVLGLFSVSALCIPATASAQVGPQSSTGLAPPAQAAATARLIARGIGRAGPVIGPENIGPIGPLPPLPPSNGVYPPGDFNIWEYGTTRVHLRWWYTGGAQTQIWRSASDGPWTVISTFGELPKKSYIDFQDQSAQINAENCYRIAISDGVNPGSAKRSPIRCVMTRDGRGVPVRRLQLRLTIANVANAGTDDAVQIRLQSPPSPIVDITKWTPSGNNTWLDSTANDYERATSLTYELMRTNVREMSDITMITIAKPGSDRMCVAGIELRVTNQIAFTRNFGQTTCAWVGGDQVLTVPFEELRSAPTWTAVGDTILTGLSASDLRAVIMGQFGHYLHGRGELRNGGVITTRFVNDRRLKVNVPIRVHDVPLLGDVSSDVHFDLVLSETDGTNRLLIENVDADSSDLLGYFLPVVGWAILYGTSETIEGILNSLQPTNLGSAPAPFRPCFKPNADLGVCAA